MLTSEQTDAFARDGALVVRGAIDRECIAEVRRAFAARVDDLIARAANIGEMSAPSAADFDSRLTALLCAGTKYYEHLDISLPMLADLAAKVPEWRQLFGEEEWRREAGFFVPDAVFRMMTHPRAAAIARQILGDDVALSPVQHVRIKPPQRLLPPAARGDANMARTLWHQDEAVVSEDAAGVPILTMWIAVSEATEKNGCMYAVRGSHLRADSERDFGLTRHCPGKDLAGEIYIPDADIDKKNLFPLEAEPGDAVLLHRRTVHGAGANESDAVRWSFDLRYQPRGTPSGRDFFPSLALHDAAAGAEAYREQWRAARDDIIGGKLAAVFNTRWNKYAALCA